jgi:hypothetical protein
MAQAGHERAELAERHARIAEQESERARAEARLHEERAQLHERGLADEEFTGNGSPATHGALPEREGETARPTTAGPEGETAPAATPDRQE